MDESLWPARNVAEYAYCPRLFYFMEVEGIFHYRPKSWGERMPLALLRLLTQPSHVWGKCEVKTALVGSAVGMEVRKGV